MERFVLKFLLIDKVIAVCLDQKISNERLNPLTEYFFWPQRDAWEDMKNFIDNNDWIDPKDAVNILNRITEVINFWEESAQLKKEDIKNLNIKFPDCVFIVM
uniref:Small ribosomal subunit protein cS23 n=2 Tax=Euglena mutabilis TaxID=38275 RepID=RRP3_EUGMU|nr:RecName: Full=Small ribosomal subunit protein cS23; AltName: Full=30S ribosomal protein 3, chloroplastic; Short=PSRP-3 [Euglena mutabilis]AAK27691.1 ycf65 [Euglena mutabilis]ABB02350.1 Ycf65 [Euglena mutabilis]AMD08065.1 putative ribosomal protein 3 [Euglena mutabilis]